MRIFCICGKARSGKDTIASIIKKNLQKKGHSVLIAHYADLVKYICKAFFDWNGEKDVNGRTLLQYVGTDIVRSQNQDYWVNFIVDILKFFKNKWEYIIIPDLRFKNELTTMREALKDSDVYCLKIVRDEFDNSLTEEQKKHPSEVELDTIIYDYLIKNNSTLEELEDTVNAVLAECNAD